MPPLTSAQKSSVVQQFIQLTGCPDRNATRLCKNANYKLNDAIDLYFSQGAASATPNNGPLLENMFVGLRNESRDRKDAIGVESSMEYLGQQLKVDLENASIFVALELFQSPSIGEITKKGFVEGWNRTGVSVTFQAQAAHMKSQTATLSTDPEYFKKVYRYAFVVGKEANQKALDLDNAIVYWGMLFSPPGMTWKTQSHDWLDLWTTYLKEKWTRSVNRDMWNMTLEFANRTLEDETLSFWNEDGAWPSVIDDFVTWCKEKGIGAQPATEAMDTME